jgi:hypothetical protein
LASFKARPFITSRVPLSYSMLLRA